MPDEIAERDRRDALATSREILIAIKGDAVDFPLAIEDPDARRTVIGMARTLLALHEELEQSEL